MSELNLATGVYNRWNDAGLDDSIETLYWGTTAPEGDVLPRAVYTLSTRNSARSRGSNVKTSQLTIQTWDATPELVSGYNDTVASAFHNSESAATNPLTMTGGTVMHCLLDDSDVIQEDENVYQGVVVFELQWTVANTTPA